MAPAGTQGPVGEEMVKQLGSLKAHDWLEIHHSWLVFCCHLSFLVLWYVYLSLIMWFQSHEL